jgi:hypothetical protein
LDDPVGRAVGWAVDQSVAWVSLFLVVFDWADSSTAARAIVLRKVVVVESVVLWGMMKCGRQGCSFE